MNSFWDALVQALAADGADTYFGLPSDEPGLLDAAAASSVTTAHLLKDQRIAALAATGYAIASQRPAVLALSPGPAFTNALTGLMEAASLGVPIVVVTTSTDPREEGRGGFQVTPQRELIAPLASWYTHLRDSSLLPWTARRAVELSLRLRPGVTVIEVDHGLWDDDPPPLPDRKPIPSTAGTPTPAAVSAAVALIDAAERPLILAGGGAQGAASAVKACALQWGAPVLTTAAGRGVVDETQPWALGCAGLYASDATADLVATADLLVVAGSALEETARIGWPEVHAVPVVQIDRDPEAFGRAVDVDVALVGDVNLTLDALCTASHKTSTRPWGTSPEPDRREELAPSVMRAVWRSLPTSSLLVQENGLHDMWSYDSAAVPVTTDATVIAPGEQTTVGFGAPAAFGAAVARPDQDILVVLGDAAIEMSAAALPDLAHLRRPPTMIVLDNNGWGWPRACRDDHAASFTTFDHRLPIQEIVRHAGGTVATVSSLEDLPNALSTQQRGRSRGELVLIWVDVAVDDISPGVRREVTS